MFSRFFDKVRDIYSSGTMPNAVGTLIAVSQEMSDAIQLWQDIYQNRAPWLWDGDTKSLNIGSAIAGEFARLVTLELKSEVSEQGERGEYLNGIYNSFLKKNIRRVCERACALGGVCLKPMTEGGRIVVDVVDPLDFYPIESNDEGEITAAAFLAHKTVGRCFYTKLEIHHFSEGVQRVESKCYKSYNRYALDNECELSEVEEWSDLPPEFVITNIQRPLFVYFRMPAANDIDKESPLGISVYSRAVELLRDADEQYTRYLWEFEGGELAIDAEDTSLQLGERGAQMPKHNKRIFRKLFRGHKTGDDTFYKEWAPPLRNESMESGINTIKRAIEFSVSLAYGTLSDANNVDKTAEEIRSSKQRSYSAVRDIQNALEEALRELVYIIGVWAGVYGLCPVGGYPQMSFEWDDSIVADRAQEFTEKTQLVRDGIMQPWELRAWYFGEDEQTARKVCAEVLVE